MHSRGILLTKYNIEHYLQICWWFLLDLCWVFRTWGPWGCQFCPYLRMLYLSFYSSRFLVLSWTCAYVTWILCAWGCQLCVYLCMQCLSFYSLRFFVVFIWVCVVMLLHVAVRCFCVQVLNLRMLKFNLKNVDLFHGVKSSFPSWSNFCNLSNSCVPEIVLSSLSPCVVYSNLGKSLASNLAWRMASLDAVVNNGLEIDIWIVFLQGVCLCLSMPVLLEHSFMLVLLEHSGVTWGKIGNMFDCFQKIFHIFY